MSATRDKNQKVTFVYSNLYEIYRKGVARAREGAIRESSENSPSLAAEALTELAKSPRPFESGTVIKAGDLNAPDSANPSTARVTSYSPAELIGKRIARPASIANHANSAETPPAAVESLKENLKSLNDLQARLRFMLQELEDLIKD